MTNELTGNTTTFSGSTGITSNIYISSGITFNLLNFNENIINRLDIIDNTINYIDNLDKYALDTLIVDNIRNYVYVDTLGEYCVKFFNGYNILTFGGIHYCAFVILNFVNNYKVHIAFDIYLG